MDVLVDIPAVGPITEQSGFIPLKVSSDGVFRVGANAVRSITATGDRKVEFIAFQEHTLAYVASSMGYPAYYPVHPVKMEKPIKAVLMDLDGTSVRSERFWIWIIQQTTARLTGRSRFELEPEDEPHVSGHSVSEHLEYCIRKYCPDKTLEEARKLYFEITHHEMKEILEGRGRQDAFVPSPGLKDFLLALKSRDIKIGLVTSGLYEKAWPEIISAFRRLDMGDPLDFYDAIITAGYALRKGRAGTLGELAPKPHPWLYAETARIGLEMPAEKRNRVIGLEDSSAGVLSIRLAGFPALGIAGGNIGQSGMKPLLSGYYENLADTLPLILGE